jgi:hypothetical protein
MLGSSKYEIAQVYRFKVEQWWKSGNEEFKDVHILKMKISTGTYVFGPEQVVFKKGERYLVYDSKEDSVLFASGCTRTRLVQFADEDLQLLGKGQRPKPSHSRK